MRPAKSAQGWDLTFTTNYLGPFVLTDALAPHLLDGASIVFVVSAVEDPECKPANVLGMLAAATYLRRRALRTNGSKEAPVCRAQTPMLPRSSARLPPQWSLPAKFHDYTSMLSNPVSLQGPDLHAMQILSSVSYSARCSGGSLRSSSTRSTPERAARLLTRILLNDDGKTGMYYDEKGEPMFASTQVRSPKFTAHVVAETRAMLAAEAGFQQSGHESQRVGTGSKRSSSTEREARRM
jgi:hypothetical protein